MATPLPVPLSPSQQQQQQAPAPQSTVDASTSTTADKTKPTSTSTTNQHDLLPRDARLIALLLAANGASDAEPAVIRILVEFAHRKRFRHPSPATSNQNEQSSFSQISGSGYTADILSDSLIYAEHARGQPSNPSGAVINLIPSIEDVRLAVQAKQESNSIPKEFLLDLATRINSNPLPPVPEVYGIRLPPQSQRLTAPNFSIVPRSEKGAVAPPQAGLDSLRGGEGEGGMRMGAGVGAGAEEEEEEGEGDGLFGSDDDDDDEEEEEEEEDEEVPIQGQGQGQGPKVNGEPEEEEEDGDDDDDEDDDDDDEDDEMQEVGEFENTVQGGTTGEGDDDEDDDEDD